MKHLKLFFALFAMLALGVGNAWGADVTETITMKGFAGITSAGYQNYTKTGSSDKGTAMVAYAFNGQTGQVRGNKTTVAGASVINEDKNKNWSLYNSQAMGGAIKAIKVTQTATGENKFQNNLFVSLGTSSQGEVTEVTDAQIQDAGGTTQEINFSIDPSKGYTYFKLLSKQQFAKGTIAGVVVTVTYETAGGSVTPDPEPDPTTYTIKWHTAVGTTTDVTLNEGATITKPATDPTMSGYVFMGWTEDCEVASDGAGFTAISNFGTATEDKDYYAVFAVATTTSGGGSTEYTLVNTISEGTYLIAVDKVNSSKYNFAIGTASGGHAAVEATGVTKSNTISSVPSEAKEYVLTGDNTNGYSIKCDDEYLVATGDKKSLSYSTTCSETWTFQVSGSGFHLTGKTYGSKMSSNSTTAASSIRNYDSSGSFYSPLYFFKKSSGSTTTTYDNYITTCASGIEYVELGDDFKWNATEAEVTIDATDNVFPTLTNTHNVPVTYSSTDDAIASIAADGTVTLNKEGTVTITAKYAGGTSAGTDKEYKAKTVTYSLKVNKAAPVASGTTYVKVTSTAGITNGEYLIVYEDAASETPAPVAFDGSLATLDAAKNTVAVGISNSTIAGNTDIDAALFTIDVTAGTLKSASGKYIGVSSNSNGLKTEDVAKDYKNAFSVDDNGNAVIAADFEGSTMSLRYNNAAGDNNLRFRYYKNAGQQPIALYKKVDASEVLAPAFSLAEGSYYGAQSVEITCATADASIYYTTDGNDPTSASTPYTSAITISETKTLKAIAIKGGNSSSITEATYTILPPLSTMEAIFAKATEIGKDATQSVQITMGGWVVSGVGTDNKTVYVTDGTKGFIINTSDHGFAVGDQLSGTVACDLMLYNGSAEVVGLTSTTAGLTVTAGGTVTTNVLDAEGIAALTGVNTGSVIKISGTCTVVDSRYYVAGVQLYNSLYTYTNPEEGYNYECTGVYLQYKTNSADVKEILPRKAEDLVKLTEKPTASISIENITVENGKTATISATITPAEAASAVTYTITSGSEYIALNGTEITANAVGTATITATIADCEDYFGATQDFTVTVTAVDTRKKAVSPSPFTAISGDMDPNDITFASYKGGGTGGPNIDENCIQLYQIASGSEYGGYITFTAIEGCKIDQVKIVTAENSTTVAYSADDEAISANTDVAEGDEYLTDAGLDAQSVNIYCMGTDKYHRLFVASAIVYYTVDTRAEAGIAWSTDAINLTVGDAFTAPTFSNPNTLTGITFTSSNEALATVDAGVISLVSGKTGTATITASFEGNETYRDAEVSCTISVNPVTDDVVILAQHNGQWYAMMAQCPTGKTERLDALPVEYINGIIYNVSAENQALITWSRAFIENQVAFQNNGNYLKGVSSTDLILEAEETGLYLWDKDTYTMTINGTVRTFLYSKTNNCFRNYSAGGASDGNTSDKEYSSFPIVTAPNFADAEIYTRENIDLGTDGYRYGTICIPYASNNYAGAEFYEVSWIKMNGTTPEGLYLDEVALSTTLEAGKPYIFKATQAKVAMVCEGTAVATPVAGENGLTGTFNSIAVDANSDLVGNYIIAQNQFWTATAENWLDANRAYINKDDVPTTEQAKIPGRRRVVMGAAGENAATGVDNIITTDAPVKVIVNGQLIIIRNGEKYNIQGQLIK